MGLKINTPLYVEFSSSQKYELSVVLILDDVRGVQKLRDMQVRLNVEEQFYKVTRFCGDGRPRELLL